MGTKYTIEVEDKPFELLSEDGFTSEKLYRVKGFNSLVFDWNGLNMLTPYTEPDLEQVREEAFDEGYQEGMQLSIDDAKLKEEYGRGLNDAWEAAKKIKALTCFEREEIFKTSFSDKVLKLNSASEAIEKIRQYEQRQEEIIDPDKNKVEALANDIGIHKLYALVKEIRGE